MGIVEFFLEKSSMLRSLTRASIRVVTTLLNTGLYIEYFAYFIDHQPDLISL